MGITISQESKKQTTNQQTTPNNEHMSRLVYGKYSKVADLFVKENPKTLVGGWVRVCDAKKYTLFIFFIRITEAQMPKFLRIILMLASDTNKKIIAKLIKSGNYEEFLLTIVILHIYFLFIHMNLSLFQIVPISF